MGKLMELEEMAKLIASLEKKTFSSFTSTWKPLLDICMKQKIWDLMTRYVY